MRCRGLKLERVESAEDLGVRALFDCTQLDQLVLDVALICADVGELRTDAFERVPPPFFNVYDRILWPLDRFMPEENVDPEVMRKALEAARGARFEHGENPGAW